MSYNDNFWHKDAHVNISSPACLIFLVKSGTSLSDLLLLKPRLIEAWLGIQQCH